MAAKSLLSSNTFAAEFKILLAEPDKTNRTLLSRLIEDLKPARFDVVKSIAEARGAMADRVEQYDCVILALKNPPTSGFHYLQEIRSGLVPRTPHDTRVVLLAAQLNKTMIKFAQQLDADGVIAIPVTVATVNNTLSAAFSRDQASKSAEDYKAVKLPAPVAKKEKASEKESGPKGPNARVVWSGKDKEKAELIRTLKESLGQKNTESEPEDNTPKINNVRTFWLKDLLPGMVLAEKITGENEELLLMEGTRLNENLIEKIKALSELGVCRSFLKAGTLPE